MSQHIIILGRTRGQQSMNYKRKDVTAQSAQPVIFRDQHEDTGAERCRCQPLSSLHTVPQAAIGQDEDDIDCDKITPATSELSVSIRMQLSNFFPHTTSLSMLLLHASQLEHIHISPQTALLHKRLHYHAPPGFLEQVLVNVRRTIRDSDQILIHKGVGAAIIFPDVDQQGIFNILERVYRSVSLLQAETVIPPLKRETDVVMGVGSYPEDGSSLEHLLYRASITARRFTLRPAITTQLWSATPHEPGETEASIHAQTRQQVYSSQALSDTQTQLHAIKTHVSIPYMQLPAQLPTRLKHLIPYSVACELRCAPVGRDHHCLTVAMIDPTDRSSIDTLCQLTGLTIYPVSCDADALDALLMYKW